MIGYMASLWELEYLTSSHQVYWSFKDIMADMHLKILKKIFLPNAKLHLPSILFRILRRLLLYSLHEE